MTTLTIHGDRISGNCLKVKWVADHLGLAYEWRDVDVVAGEAQMPPFIDQNPFGRVPFLQTGTGEGLAESNAIIAYLAEGSELVPAAPLDRARMLQWMFWEQYSHEPYIAVRRFQMHYLGRGADELDDRLFDRGTAALALMELTLAGSRYFVGDALTLADVALVAYTRVAGEGGFDLANYPAVEAWVARVEAGLSIG